MTTTYTFKARENNHETWNKEVMTTPTQTPKYVFITEETVYSREELPEMLKLTSAEKNLEELGYHIGHTMTILEVYEVNA